MNHLYTLGILLYGLAIRIASLFNPKARQWVKGRRRIFGKLDEWLQANLRNGGADWKGTAWFHCASLGEFEQGRPLIEGFRALYPEYRILLTFYSPSGYEVRKAYDGADGVFYMPLDTPVNARRWISRLNPRLVFFIKYEYWFNFLQELDRRHIPVCIVSAIFHHDQPFFKQYGSWFRKQLSHVSWFYLQSEEMKVQAGKLGIKNFTITGDTRFDRVWTIREQRKSFPLIRQFAGESRIFLGGSTWEPDEALIIGLIATSHPDMKFIIAPHEVYPSRIEALEISLQVAAGTLWHLEAERRPRLGVAASGIRDPGHSVLRYSALTPGNASSARIILVDTIGILAHLYQYATFSYIGGGFGVGIHNILEAAAFGNPVIFGPNYRKFTEARELIQAGGAFCIHDAKELAEVMDRLLGNEEEYQRISSISLHYVENNRGAARRILQGIQTLGFIAPPRQGA